MFLSPKNKFVKFYAKSHDQVKKYKRTHPEFDSGYTIKPSRVKKYNRIHGTNVRLNPNGTIRNISNYYGIPPEDVSLIHGGNAILFPGSTSEVAINDSRFEDYH